LKVLIGRCEWRSSVVALAAVSGAFSGSLFGLNFSKSSLSRIKALRKFRFCRHTLSGDAGAPGPVVHATAPEPEDTSAFGRQKIGVSYFATKCNCSGK
jgi:hypothetical protein